MIYNLIVTFLLISFLGYFIGRVADNYFNVFIGDPWWIPDHWILGFIIMISGLFYFEGDLAVYLSSFGFGYFISDLKDFLRFKFYGPDNKTKEDIRFWHID